MCNNAKCLKEKYNQYIIPHLTKFPQYYVFKSTIKNKTGHLRKNQKLATSGPYSFTRNPLYLGTLITALGLAAAGDSAGLGILFATLFTLVYLPAIELEEQHLTAILPDYAAYAERVPLLVPTVPLEGLGPDSFSFAQDRKNREYEALGGWLLAVVWLVTRTFWHW